MSPQDIEAILQPHLDGGTLKLPVDAFGAGVIAKTLGAYLPSGATLDIVDAELTPGTQDVTVRGKGSVAPFAGTTVTAVFDGSGSEVQLLLTATAPSAWRFDTAFDQLGGSVLTELDYSDVTLVLSTSAPAASALTLATTAKFNGDIGVIGWLLGNIFSFALKGPIAMSGNVPVFTLQADIAQVSLEPLGTLAPAFQIASSAMTWYDHQGAAQTAAKVTLGLAANMTVKRKKVPIFIDLSTPKSVVAIEADLSAAANLALADLGSLAGGADLASYVPSDSGFPGINAVAGLSFQLNPAQQKIVSIAVQAAVSGDWPIIRGVTLTGGRMSFAVLDPLGALQVLASVEATASWPGGTLGVGVAIAKTSSGLTGTLYAALREGSVVHINDVIDYFLSVDIPATLDLDGLDLGITVPSLDWYFDTSLSGNWTLPLGFTSVALTGASAQLEHNGGATTGTISATATVADIDFDATWNLHEQFTLTGKFPDINLTELGSKLTGTSTPSGLPVVTITHAQASLTIANEQRAPVTRAAQWLVASDGGKMYDFMLSATATANGHDLGSGFFEVRRTAKSTGFVVGFAVPEAWSPGDLFPPLADLFSGLSFRNTGLIVSTIAADKLTLPNLTMPVPTPLPAGVTAFTTLQLKGDGLDLLKKLFTADVTLNLVAQIDSTTPAKSLIKASLPSFEVNKDFTFKELAVVLKPGAAEFDLVAAAALKIGGETLVIAGQGSIKLEPPAVAFDLAVENWPNPFGIAGLTVANAGVAVVIGGTGVTIGMLGSFVIGTAPRQFTFTIGASIIDFEVPGALLFGLDASDQALKLTDLITEFTTLDLSSVPVLNGIAFKTIDLYIVDDPNGFKIGNQSFQPGIQVKADVLFYDWEVIVDVAVNQDRGVYAMGNVNLPIKLGDDLLVISDFQGTKGPSFLIDTAAFTSGVALVARDAPRFSTLHRDSSISTLALAHDLATLPAVDRRPLLAGEAATYLELSGNVKLLGGAIQDKVYLKASRDTLDFEYDFTFLGMTEQLSCHLSMAKMSLAASAKFGFSLKIDLPAYKINGLTVIPPIHIPGVAAGLTLGAGLALSPVGGSFSIGLSFSYAGQNFTPNFTLTLTDITHAIGNLWDAIATWLKNNVKLLYANILSSLENFAAAIASGLIAFGNDLVAAAKAMMAAFDASIEQIGQVFKQLGKTFEDACNAIAEAFGKTAAAVAKALDDIWAAAKGCAMQGAAPLMHATSLGEEGDRQRDDGLRLAVAYELRWRQALFDMAALPGGRELLFHYYLHQHEIVRLITIEGRNRVLPATKDADHPLRELGDRLAAIRPNASPELAKSIETMLAIAEPYVDRDYALALELLAA
ncbi:hypothetical protein OKW76_08105 [Sphingomonas sp. S1-29]|uniref:hypothetical protein n=1 Tax=Sphingomonas sp. S1-29 TaxID=2991074 RepID=UPI0022409399|nr:hypothetical protein [Sphingomonas sp. S1-29]UZK68048.1 hypothetical protein OKW76_08105 [Sphingomonas sp. S1-29]